MISFNEQNKEQAAIEAWSFSKTPLGDMNVLSLRRPANHYFRTRTPKTKIVLHYTAGSLAGDIGALTSGNKVSVPFLVPRNGTILNLFSPDFWAYHLGPNSLGGNMIMSMASIGIEITNQGWLTERNGFMYNWAGAQYCSIEDKHLYVNEPEYRGKNIWATFTDEQYDSVRKIIQYLTANFPIKPFILPPEERLEYSESVIKMSGIFTHSNFRRDKWDIGPAFDWNRIMP